MGDLRGSLSRPESPAGNPDAVDPAEDASFFVRFATSGRSQEMRQFKARSGVIMLGEHVKQYLQGSKIYAEQVTWQDTAAYNGPTRVSFKLCCNHVM
jgi:hypothetical protein